MNSFWLVDWFIPFFIYLSIYFFSLLPRMRWHAYTKLYNDTNKHIHHQNTFYSADRLENIEYIYIFSFWHVRRMWYKLRLAWNNSIRLVSKASQKANGIVLPRLTTFNTEKLLTLNQIVLCTWMEDGKFSDNLFMGSYYVENNLKKIWKKIQLKAFIVDIEEYEMNKVRSVRKKRSLMVIKYSKY